MTDTEPTEPTQEQIDTWNREVQVIIDRAAAMGETLTPKEAGTRLMNTIKNVSENPELVEKLAAIPERVDSLEDRVAHLEEIGGGVAVGGDSG